MFGFIVELSQGITNVKENINNTNNLFYILIVVILAFLLVAFTTGSVNEQGISPAFFLLPIFFIGIFSFFYYIIIPKLEKNTNDKITKTKLENEKKIVDFYNSNLQLFDNKKTKDVNFIIKISKEKKEKFDNEVNNITNEISNKLQDNKLYLEQEKIKPFAQLYVMDKEKIPVLDKVQQKVSPDDTGKICEAIKVKNCFNNSSFDDYNLEKKNRVKQ